MFYVWNITVPKNTTEEDAQETVLDIHPGIICQVDVMFPPGHAGLTGLQIFDSEHQVWPSIPGEYFRGDDATVTFREWYPITSVPYELNCFTWNTDDTYDHTITLRIGILEDWQLNPLVKPYWEYYSQGGA